jgi:glutamate racemase
VAFEGPIGVFDSGVGGLSVVREIRSLMPSLDIRYFGDTARVPYGNKSAETVVRYSLEIGKFLEEQGIAVLVVACNTSSAFALEALEKTLPVPVLGMIEPGAKKALEATRSGRIGLIGTRGTVNSGAYARAIRAKSPEAQVISKACPLFVPLVEEGWASDPVAREVARRYLDPLLDKGVDTVILGCTHYPALIPVLQEVVGEGVNLVSSAEEAAQALWILLEGKGYDTRSRGGGRLKVYVTDSGTHFQRVGVSLLGDTIPVLHKIDEERLVAP